MKITVCAHSSIVERPAFNRQVPGASPGGHTKRFLSSAGQSTVLRKPGSKVRILQEAPYCSRSSVGPEYPASNRFVASSNLAGSTKCRFSPMAEALVLGTSCSRFESEKRHQIASSSNGQDTRLSLGRCRVQFPLALPKCFRSSVDQNTSLRSWKPPVRIRPEAPILRSSVVRAGRS